MTSAKAHSKSSSDSEGETSARIIEAARRLFAEHGFDGASIKDICAAADVNIAAIHYHFGSKEELFRHLLEQFGGRRLEAIQRTLAPPNTSEELRVRLELFISESIEAFIEQPELFRIIQAETELVRARSESVFRKTFLKHCDTLVGFLSHARKKGLIAKQIEPRDAARMLFSQIAHPLRTDAIYKKFYGVSLRQDAYRKRWVAQTLGIFLNGILSK